MKDGGCEGSTEAIGLSRVIPYFTTRQDEVSILNSLQKINTVNKLERIKDR